MLLFVGQEVILVSDFSAAAVNLPRLSRVGGKWRRARRRREGARSCQQKKGASWDLEQRAQFVRQREEGRGRLGLATLLH